MTDNVGSPIDELNERIQRDYHQRTLTAAKNLKPQHLIFVNHHVLEGLRLGESYLKIRPSASKHTASEMASTIMRRADVKEYLSALRDYETCKVLGGVGWKKGMLMKVAMRSMQEEQVLDRKGKPTGEFTFRGDWVSKAIAEMNKMDGDNAPDKHELSGPGGGPIESKIIGFEVVEYDDDDDTSEYDPEEED